MKLWKREPHPDRITCRVCGVVFLASDNIDYAFGGISRESAKSKFKRHEPPIGCFANLKERLVVTLDAEIRPLRERVACLENREAMQVEAALCAKAEPRKVKAKP